MFINSLNTIPSTLEGCKQFLLMYAGEEIVVGLNEHMLVLTPSAGRWQVELDGHYEGSFQLEAAAEELAKLKRQSMAFNRYQAYRGMQQQVSRPQPRYSRMPLDPEPEALPRSTSTSDPIGDLVGAGINLIGNILGAAARTSRRTGYY